MHNLKNKPLVLDLFCGAGGMSEGLLQAGFHIVYSNDISEDAMETYINRHEQLGYIHKNNTFHSCKDINELSAEEIIKDINSIKNIDKSNIKIDAIFGGPPCQGFSRAGRRNSEDPRNKLFKEYLRIIKDLKPTYVVMENVEGFLDTKFENFTGITGKKYKAGKAPEILIMEFKKIGYKVLKPKLLNASDYGVPQIRKRAIFIAYIPNSTIPNYPVSSDKKKITLKEAIYDLSNKEIKPSGYAKQLINGRTKDINRKKIEYDKIIKRNTEISIHNEIITERFSLYNYGESTADLRKRINKNGIDLSNCKNILKYLKMETSKSPEEIANHFKKKNISAKDIDLLLTRKNIRRKLDPKLPSPTMVTLPDDFINPFENRILSVREMARIQSFDDSFVFLGKRTTGGHRRKLDVPQYTQVGNAVPPLLAKAIAVEIIKAIKNEQ